MIFDHVHNASVIDLNHPTELHYMHSVSISAVFAMCSGLICFFALSTFQMAQQGIENTSNVAYEEFTNSNAGFVNDPMVVLWNNTFIALVLISHEMVTAVICTPNSMHFLLMMAGVYYISFSVILQPKLQAPEGVPNASSGLASTYLVAVSFYVIGMIYVCSNISFDPQQTKVQFVTLLMFVDFFMIMGHIWDPAPLMSTVMNCRFMYLVCIIFINLCMYVMWERLLKVPYVRI